MSKLEKIQTEILSLTSEERELVGIFLKNAENTIGAGYHEAWEKELHRRLDEVKNGDVQLLSAKSVISDLRKKISG